MRALIIGVNNGHKLKPLKKVVAIDSHIAQKCVLLIPIKQKEGRKWWQGKFIGIWV